MAIMERWKPQIAMADIITGAFKFLVFLGGFP